MHTSVYTYLPENTVCLLVTDPINTAGRLPHNSVLQAFTYNLLYARDVVLY